MAVLVSDHASLQAMLNIVDEYCSINGLSLNISKSVRMLITGSNKTFTVNYFLLWSVKDETLATIGPEQSYQYLRANVCPWTGVYSEPVKPTIENWINNISNTPLKPHQRSKCYKKIVCEKPSRVSPRKPDFRSLSLNRDLEHIILTGEIWKRKTGGLALQGHGVELFKDLKSANYWLPKHVGMKAYQWVKCLALRANVYSTKEALSRCNLTKNNESAKCRGCIAT
ncbi:uncharacterized protein LOC143251555 [Tachypleus tridentatus]|uniref:uncharacterized protein LOC143251555 n=1 Tax=Tachypleus tridentatus TaxID=6853 RepID=UPI003FD12640